MERQPALWAAHNMLQPFPALDQGGGVWDRLMDAIGDVHGGDLRMIYGTSVRVHHGATTPDHSPGPSRSTSWIAPARSYYENPCFDR